MSDKMWDVLTLILIAITFVMFVGAGYAIRLLQEPNCEETSGWAVPVGEHIQGLTPFK